MDTIHWTTDNIPDLTDKTVIVTGGNSGLGHESVMALAMKNATVISACRNIEKGAIARARILEEYPAADIRVMQLDLADLQSVRKFAAAFKSAFSRLDILLNNAGIMTTPYHLTQDGFEGQMGTNHLGHFALTGLLLDIIAKTPGARVVTVSSGAHKSGRMDFDNLLFENGKKYTPMRAYSRSKLANLLFTYELQRYFVSMDINALAAAAHPGGANTNLFRHAETGFFFKLIKPLFKKWAQTPAMGTLPQLRAAAGTAVRGGDYIGPDGRYEIKGYPVKVRSTRCSHNRHDARRLWEISEKLTGIRFEL